MLSKEKHRFLRAEFQMVTQCGVFPNFSPLFINVSPMSDFDYQNNEPIILDKAQ